MSPSPLVDDGYDIADYDKILPDLGTLAEFETFVAEADQGGIGVITDLVMNHTSQEHAWFQASRHAERKSKD
jgi:glycosidase